MEGKLKIGQFIVGDDLNTHKYLLRLALTETQYFFSRIMKMLSSVKQDITHFDISHGM